MTYFNAPYRPADLTVDSSHSLVAGMQLWFPFTSGRGTSAPCLFHASHNGTLQSGASWASSDIGTVLELDGNSEVDFTSDISRNKTAVSCSAWIKPDSVSGNHFVFYEENGTVTHRTRFGLRVDGGRIECVGRDDDGDSFTRFAQSNTGTVVTGVWQHAVAVFDPTGGGCKVYLDGVDVTASSDNTGDGFPNTASLNQVIGGIGGHSSFLFDGQIQNLRVYDRALSATEVATLYHRPWTGTNYDTEALWLSPPASPTLSTASQATSIMTSCLGWWPLTEGSGTTATDLMGSNDGTLTSGVGWKETALGTSSEHTHGNDYISTGLDLTGESAVTVSAWVRSDGVAAGIYGKIVCQAHNANFDMHMAVTQAASLNIRINSTTVVANNSDVPPNGTWFHVCAVWQQSSRQEIYVNGKLSASVTADTSVIGSNPHNVFIGGTTARSSRGFDGGIQNVRIWNRALSSDEVSTLYERPWIGAEYNESFYLYPPVPSSLTPLDSSSINTDLEAWWPLTQTTGSTCTDISGNSLDGTQNGTEVWQNSELGYVHESSGTSQNYFDNCGSTSDFAFAHTTGIITISCWIRPTATGRSFILANNDTSGANGFFFDRKNGDGMNFYMGTSGTGGTTSVSTANGTAPSDGTWQHWVFVLDTGNAVAQFYKNGVAVATTGTIASTGAGSTTTRYTTALGGLSSVPSETFDGDLQNVRVWSRALSASEVADIYYSPWLGSAYTGSSSDPATNRFFSPATFARLG